MSSAGWTFIQDTGNTAGTGGITFAPAATTAGTLLIAKFVAPTTTTSTPPNSNWWLARHYPAPGGVGMVEVWYMLPRYNTGGITSVAFTGAGGVLYRGALQEQKPPANTDVILESAGQASGASGGSFPVSTIRGNAAASLGVALVGVFYSATVTGTNTWGGAAGWTLSSKLNNGLAFTWGSYYHLNLAKAASQAITPTFSFTTNETGWAAVVLTFRARAFQNLRLDGAEVSNYVTQSADKQAMLMLGDVEGIFTTVTPKPGDQWQQAAYGVWQDHWGQVATAEFSPFPSGSGDVAGTTIYAGVGKNNDGGFLVSTDGGATWSMRSTAVQFVGNNARSPLPTNFHVRSTGNLLAFDTTNNLIYAATYNGGIARSADRGATWTVIGLADGNYYPRTIVINPGNVNELWVGCYDHDGTGAFGKVWHCTTASTATATSGVGPFTQDAGAPGIVEELRVIGSFLYAACNVNGLYRQPLAGGAWTNLNGGPIDAVSTTNLGSLWTSVHGWIDGSSNHQIVAACDSGVKQGANTKTTNVVQVSITPGGVVSYTAGPLSNGDLTGGSTLNTATIPPDGRAFWKSSATLMLGKTAFAIPHILVDSSLSPPALYLAGYGGFYRSYDGGSTWDMPVNGANMSKFNFAAIDPGDPNHWAVPGSDTEHSDLTDPTGSDPAKWKNFPFPQTKAESHGAAFDPVDSRVYGICNTKYGANDGGGVYYRAPRPAGSGSSVWTDMGFVTGSRSAKAAIGIYAGRDGRPAPNNRFVCVVQQGVGMWRWDGANWSQADSTIGTSGQTAQVVPIIRGHSPQYLYCWDRGQGVYRSADYGVSWAKIWDKSVSDIRSGWLAINANVPGELWVSHDTGLAKLSNASSGTVAGGQITVTSIPTFSNGAGGVAFGPDGHLYVVQLAYAAQPYNMLLVATDPNVTVSSAWQDACGGDGSFSDYARLPAQLLINSNGLIWCNTDTNQAIFGTPAAAGTPVVTITTMSCPAATNGVGYSLTLAAVGGTSPYAWSLASGSLPTGLSLSAGGVISGTPTVNATYNFTVQATDSSSPSGSDTQALTIVVASPVSVTTVTLPNGQVAQPYSQALAASGGVGAPYTWTVTGGALPAGLSLSPGGTISGTPTVAGSFSFTVTAKDSGGRAGSASLSITVTAPTLVITTVALASGTVAMSYSAQFGAAGGTPPYSWAVISGQLPPGLIFSTTGALAGVPTTKGSYTFTVQVTDSLSATASASFTIVIYPQQVIGYPKGPWKILYGPCQPVGGYAGSVSQAASRQIILRAEPGQYHEVTVDINGREAAAMGIAELQTDFTVYYGSQLLTCTRVWPTQNNLDAGTHRRQVGSRDYREVLRRRFMLTGDPPAGSQGSNLSWTQVEQAAIAWEMIKSTQARPGGNLGIVPNLGQITGIKRTHTVLPGDYVADDIDVLAQMANGFEWLINPYGPVDLRLDIYFPQMGQDRGVVLAWNNDRISSIAPRSVDPSAYANAVYVTGNSAKSLTAQQLDASDIATRPEGRWESTIGTQINTQLSLNDWATQRLAQLQVVVPAYTIVFYPGAWGGPGDIWIGDQVTVRINDGHLRVNDKLRVVEMQFELDADNRERLTLTAGMIPFRPHQHIRKILQLLRYLATR